MSDDTATALLEEVRLLRGEIDGLRADLAARSTPTRPRLEPYTVAEFAAIVRRSSRFISTRCRSNRIKALPGKPYLIPVPELARFLDTR